MYKCVNNSSHTYSQNTADGFCPEADCRGIGYLINETSQLTGSTISRSFSPPSPLSHKPSRPKPTIDTSKPFLEVAKSVGLGTLIAIGVAGEMLKSAGQAIATANRNYNLWAWSALVLALFAIIPTWHFLAGIAAVICGLIGRGFAEQGKNLARLGILLGALMIVFSFPMPDVGSWWKNLTKDSTVYDVQAIKARVIAFRFYESGDDNLPQKGRNYGRIFTKSKTRYVNWEVNFEYPPAQNRTDFTLKAIWYRADGSVVTEQTSQTYTNKGWNNSYHNSCYGTKKLGGYWQKGSYRVELYADGKRLLKIRLKFTSFAYMKRAWFNQRAI
jgi:hypothetical protein